MAQKPPDLDDNLRPIVASSKPPDLDDNHQPMEVSADVTKEATEPTVDTSQLDPEQQSIFDKAVAAWHQQTSPLVDLTPKMKQAQEQFSTEHPYIGPALKTGLDLLLGMTSPLNIETAGVGMGEAAAAKYGLPLAARGLNLIGKGLSGGMAVEGGANLFGKDKSLGERLGGGLEMLLGARGMKSSPKVSAIANEEIRPNINDIGDLAVQKPNLRLQLDETGKTTGAINTQTGEVLTSPQAKGPNYYQTPVKGLMGDERYQARKDTAIERFPEEVNNKLEPLAEQYRSAGGPGRERGDAARQMIGIRKFMEGEGIVGVGGKGAEQQFDPVSGKPLLSEHLGDVIDKRQSSKIKEALMLPKGLMASWDLSAPGRQALPLMLNKEWWTSWGSMVKAGRSEEAFKSIQQAIADKPLFRDYGQGSLAKKVGLHLTDLTDLSSREEQLMSNWAEKVPGVRASNRAYTAYLNKLRADTFERLMNDAKVLGVNGEYDLTAAKKIANFVNVATGRGSLGSLEKYATELNTVFFSPRLIASRLQILDPRHYWAAPPALRKQAIKSLFAIAGTTNLVGEMIKNTGAGTVENNPTSSDFRKYKIGNTRIDPFGGFQQYVVLAARLLENQSKSSVSGKTTELGKGYRAPDRLDVLQNFGESKLNPAISLAEGILRGKNFAGKPIDIPEEIAQRFVPLFLQDLKAVATENPNLIPGYSDLGLENFNPKRMMLALPGAFGAGIQNYPSR